MLPNKKHLLYTIFRIFFQFLRTFVYILCVCSARSLSVASLKAISAIRGQYFDKNQKIKCVINQ